jgi:hypothetical protein
MTEPLAATPDGLPAEDEFAGIPSPKYGRNPFVATVAILLCAYMLWMLRDKLAYYFASATPVELSAAQLAAPGAQPPLGRYVRVSGVGERSAAVLIDTLGSHKFRHMFPFVETGPRVWVLRRMGHTRLADAAAEAYTGRLARFDELNFAGTIRATYAAADAGAVPLDPQRPTLPAGTSRIAIAIGCPGGQPRVPLAELESRLAAGGRDLCAGATAPIEFKSLEPGQISSLPAIPNLIRAVALGPATIPPDALVLLEAEYPKELWYVPLFYAAMLLFIAFNAYLLILRLRSR